MANDQDDVETLAGFLGDEDPPVGRILAAISAACVDNARLVRNRAGICGAVGSRNDFGDAQLEVDVLCDANTVRHLGDVSDVSSVASEEKPCHTPLHPETGDYSVAYDPLDGSSIVGCNWSVGSIVCPRLYLYINLYTN